MISIEQLQILSLALIGKHGEPIYLRNFTPQTGGEVDLKWFYAAHTSLDIFEERDLLPHHILGNYFGLLYTMEDYVCYGFQSNTKIRVVICLAVRESLVRDQDVQKVLKSIYLIFVDHISNPFYQIPIDSPTSIVQPIKSKSFDLRIQKLLGL
ncbi:Longin-like domain-containing protein [Phakopsora pachyrhizi]|uniref:Trafficking protein particle complex subunit 2-like protein n=1 Tax=Phakopsora pachyrhizi TaxID=170000 RepID=A0AAV0BP52_PHAPC|nr:Longin-like domain-containing protein [Phakopsora pachyrhizi]CAH7689083.1 Longin-like domain-containing protein [Phakopsora pachyrhizi]